MLPFVLYAVSAQGVSDLSIIKNTKHMSIITVAYLLMHFIWSFVGYLVATLSNIGYIRRIMFVLICLNTFGCILLDTCLIYEL